MDWRLMRSGAKEINMPTERDERDEIDVDVLIKAACVFSCHVSPSQPTDTQLDSNQ